MGDMLPWLEQFSQVPACAGRTKNGADVRRLCYNQLVRGTSWINSDT